MAMDKDQLLALLDKHIEARETVLLALKVTHTMLRLGIWDIHHEKVQELLAIMDQFTDKETH